MKRWIWALVFTIPALAADTRAQSPTSRPAYEFHDEVRADPPLHLHYAIVDLTNPAVHVKVCPGGTDPELKAPWEATLMPVSEMAQRDGLTLAVNGNFFAAKDFEYIFDRKVYYFKGNWARACGWAMSDGKLFSRRPMMHDWPTLLVTKDNRITIGQFNRLPEGVGQAVSGQWQIVTDGENSMPSDALQPPNLAPRTAIGFDQSQTHLIFLVIDGRRPEYSAGVTVHQLADEMIRLGAYEAINLDSGGSSTMVLRDEQGNVNVVNRPSDGHDFIIPLSIERAVVDCIGIVVDPTNSGAKSASGN
jgi:exopolysaccharide biosynthesis protein